MDGILVQDSDWSRKLSLSLYDLLKKKLLCDLGIVCSTQNDVTSIKSNEVVMVHRCVLSAASETIKHLSVGGQVYNLVKINGVNISVGCWDKVLEFVYCGHTTVEGSQLCDVRRAAQVLQIKALERAVHVHHAGYPMCVCPNRDLSVHSFNFSSNNKFVISSDKWGAELFEAMLDLLVKQTLCNMTIITEKSDKSSAEILAHLCMLVAASGTIRELVLQGSDTYNSVKIDSIAYNTWLYLLEYIYTSRVSIVKSNIPEVWVASQLLQIDGLANAVSPFASQITATRGVDGVAHQTQSVPQAAVVQTSPCKTEQVGDSNQRTISESPMALNQTLTMDMKSEPRHVSCGISSESPPSVVNDDNSLGLSLTSDSCETQSNPLDLPTTDSLSGDQAVTDSAIDGHSVLADMDSNNIKSELTADFASEMSPLSRSPSSTSQLCGVAQGAPAGSQILHNARFIPVQTAGGGLVQAAPQIVSGMGQWLQTMGLDGSTPTMLWLPQGMIPVVAPPQAQALDATEAPKEEPLKVTSPAKSENSPAAVCSPKESVSTIASSSKTPEKTFLYFCRKCERVFSQSSYLEKHKCSSVLQFKTVSSTRTGSGVPPETVAVSSPRAVSVLQSEAVSSTRAIRSATTTNKLQCKFCRKIFSRTWTLNVHMRTHTGERPYKCAVCNKAFSDKSNMRQHTLIHTENKQYRCPNCQQAFAQKRYMKKHFVETCRRKVVDPDASGEKDENSLVEFDDDMLSGSKSPTDQTEQSAIIYVPHQEGSSTFRIVKGEPLEGVTNTHSKWDTSIIMSGDDVTMIRDEDTDSEHAQLPSPEPEDPLTCRLCKKRFKTERQLNSHRCR